MAVIKLTNRQKEIVQLIAKGITIPEIAVILHISESTVVSHRSTIYRILKREGVTNKDQLTQYA